MATVKICGARHPDDARLAARLGADFVGIVLVRGSRRHVPAAEARRIVAGAEGRIRTVGVFADETADRILAARLEVGVDLVQLHGPISRDDFERLVGETGGRVVRAYSPAEIATSALHRGAFARLFDAPRPGAGEPWGWSAVAGAPREIPLWLAGGLTPGNVAEAVAAARPDGVDVASGVEDEGGEWDAGRVEAFVEAARTALAPPGEGAPR
jgi:phosphoribosylanthranilate isomerase